MQFNWNIKYNIKEAKQIHTPHKRECTYRELGCTAETSWSIQHKNHVWFHISGHFHSLEGSSLSRGVSPASSSSGPFNQWLIKSTECCGPLGRAHINQALILPAPKNCCLCGGRADEGSSVATAARHTRKSFSLLRTAGQQKNYVLWREHYCAGAGSRQGVQWKAIVISFVLPVCS